MMSRDTGTGAVLEAMVLPALKRGGYTYEKQVKIGKRPGGGTHKVDAIAEKGTEKILVSLKWQQVGGTAEQKVPFEVICLAEEVRQKRFQKAYLALGGDGWTFDCFESAAIPASRPRTFRSSFSELTKWYVARNRSSSRSQILRNVSMEPPLEPTEYGPTQVRKS